MTRLLLLFLLSLIACSECPEKVPPFTWETIQGREERDESIYALRRPVYRIKVPKQWKKIEPKSHESLIDTTQPNAVFCIDESLKFTIHTFPNAGWQERIPPLAQVERWKKQLGSDNILIEPISHGGFAGYFFKGEKEEKGILGWSLSLDPELYQNLLYLGQSSEEQEFYRQMSADVTLKISGPISLLKKHQKDLVMAAKSFELIQSLPILK